MALGRASLVVSLPKPWIKMNNLQRGDMVSIMIQRDKSLVLFPSPGKTEKSLTTTLRVDPTESVTSLERRIIACYLNGFVGIRLVSTDIFTVSQQRTIRRVASKLYMRIFESDSKNIYIQTLIDESKASVETALRRMGIISISMCQDSLKSLETRDSKLAKLIISLDDDVDHFAFFIKRLLRSACLDPKLSNQLGIESLDCLDYYAVVQATEHAADSATDIAKHIVMLDGRQQRLPDKLTDILRKAVFEAIKAYEDSVKAFFSKDSVLANDVIDRSERVEELDRRAAERLTGEMNPLVVCGTCSIRESITRIMECASDISKVTVNHAFIPSESKTETPSLKPPR